MLHEGCKVAMQVFGSGGYAQIHVSRKQKRKKIYTDIGNQLRTLKVRLRIVQDYKNNKNNKKMEDMTKYLFKKENLQS